MHGVMRAACTEVDCLLRAPSPTAVVNARKALPYLMRGDVDVDVDVVVDVDGMYCLRDHA